MENKCPICLVDLENNGEIIKTNCHNHQHIFHKECIKMD